MTRHSDPSAPRPSDSSASPAGASAAPDGGGLRPPTRLTAAMPPFARPHTPPPAAPRAPSSGEPGPDASEDDPQVVLRGPADLAEVLPYLLGFHPDDSIVLLGLHGRRGRFGARLRAGIPAAARDWPTAAAQLADGVVRGAGPGPRPDAVAVFVCPDPRPGERAVEAMERLRPLAQRLRTACGALDVPVVEALCVVDGRWWSYTCPTTTCCPPEGTPLRDGGTSVMAAAAAFAGVRVHGSLRELEARFAPPPSLDVPGQLRAFQETCGALLPRMAAGTEEAAVKEETIALAGAALERFRAAPASGDDLDGDAHDDGLLGADEAAAIILGLQDRATRDRAAEWMEGGEAMPALRLWRALARRCVGAYADHAAPPLTLAGWVAWAGGDETTARVALGLALRVDHLYTFARLLHQACNHGLDPEPLRHCLRQERRERLEGPVAPAGPRRRGAGTAPKGRPDRGAGVSAGTRPGGGARTRGRTRAGGGGGS